VGGTDQVFNIVTASRRVMSALGAQPNVAVIVGILPGTDGVTKMSKSLGNHVPLTAGPDEMFAMIMSIPDSAMRAWFELASRLSQAATDRALCGHPRDAKVLLARTIVAQYHSSDEADRAAEAFHRVHSRRELPQGPGVCRLPGTADVVEALTRAGLASTRSDARRLVAQGGVRFDGEPVADPRAVVCREGILQVGRRRFVRIVPDSGRASGPEIPKSPDEGTPR
jgi:tyrosyl-tRNA synthetase